MHVRDLGRRTLFSFALFFIAFLLLPGYTHAANLSITPAAGSVAAGKTISVQVMLDPSEVSFQKSPTEPMPEYPKLVPLSTAM